MTHPNPSTALATTVIDQLVAEGVETVVISPGSRSAALAIAATRHGSLRSVVAIDERSAGFHALGVARAGGAPAAVIATSGTAPSNYFPAVVEADMSCVPLVVISADRPAELRGVGANQTIDQVRLFGDKVRAFADIPAPVATVDANRTWRETVSRLLGQATSGKPGPVHVNISFREPTVPVSDDGRSRADPYPYPTPRLDIRSHTTNAIESLELPSLSSERGVVIAGDGDYDPTELRAVAERLGWPILATALSGMRGDGVVTSYGHILAGGVPDRLRPETVVAIGSVGPGTAPDRLFAAADNRIRVDRWGRTIDPDRNATAQWAADPVRLLSRFAGSARGGWLGAWEEADLSSRRLLDDVLDSCDRPSGAGVARALDDIPWGALVVASSLPIRDVDAHLNRSGPVYANRGASGVDGFVSTALGVGSVHPGTIALSGDISLLHDANGFLIDVDIDLTLVVIDNGGGGLFDSLPQAGHAPEFERLFVADPDRDLADLARLHHLDFHLAESVDGMVETARATLAAGGRHLVVVPVDRDYDLAVRRRLLAVQAP